MARRARPPAEEPRSVAQRTLTTLSDEGLSVGDKPRVVLPDLYADLTELTGNRLMSLMVDFVNWTTYAGGQLAIAAVNEKECEGHLAIAQARAAVAARTEKTVAAQKAMAADDPEVQEATAALTEAYARRKILESVHAGLEAKGRVISRELTRRTGTSSLENRTGKWGT